ncbi:MAG TPA: hypothetical protein VMB34_02230 [Acetobacteraceae bacterium]|nr:hypothetical protein [Acetobacteraceae bacterium]
MANAMQHRDLAAISLIRRPNCGGVTIGARRLHRQDAWRSLIDPEGKMKLPEIAASIDVALTIPAAIATFQHHASITIGASISIGASITIGLGNSGSGRRNAAGLVMACKRASKTATRAAGEARFDFRDLRGYHILDNRIAIHCYTLLQVVVLCQQLPVRAVQPAARGPVSTTTVPDWDASVLAARISI